MTDFEPQAPEEETIPPTVSPDVAALQAEIARLQAENQAARAPQEAVEAPVEDPAVTQLKQQVALLTESLNRLRGNRGMPEDTSGFKTHVVTGDQEHNLGAIGEQHSVDPALIYAHNAVTLEGNAQARGFRDSEGGRLVWAGTPLKVPVSA